MLQNFESIPHVSEEYLDHYGGSVALADYCPYIQEFTWKSQNVVVRGSHCSFPENNPGKGGNPCRERGAADFSYMHRVIILLETACLHNRIGRN